MKKAFLLFSLAAVLMSLFVDLSFSQTPQAFQYQAIARDTDGNPMAEQLVSIRLSLLPGSETAVAVYSETHTKTTNKLGLVTIDVGKGTPVTGDFSSIDWRNTSMYLKVEMDPSGGSDFADMGTSEILSVPYALHAASAEGNLSGSGLAGNIAYWTGASSLGSVPYIVIDDDESFQISSRGDAGDDDPIFEVRNREGQVVFGVYQTGVRIYVEETDESKGSRSGFAVGGFTRDKQDEIEYLRVDPGSVRITIDEEKIGDDTGGTKGSRGGFAVGGFTQSKGDEPLEFLRVDPGFVRISIDDSKPGTDDDNGDETKGSRAGFAVGGFTHSKQSESDYFSLTPASALFSLDETGLSKGTRAGFAVGGFTSSKDGLSEYLNISGSAEAEIIDPSQARILWYPEREAFLAGRVLVEHPDSVGTNSWASGFESKAIGDYSQALGYESVARGNFSTAIGRNAIAAGNNSFAFGNNSVAGSDLENELADNAYAIGQGSLATSEGSYAIGFEAEATGQDAFAIGRGTEASGLGSFAIGFIGQDSLGNVTDRTKATEDWAVAIGMGAKATGQGAFALGTMTEASGGYSLATGYRTTASGYYASAFGQDTEAEGWLSSAFGWETLASGGLSFATGWGSEAGNWSSVAMGQTAKARGYASVALGYDTEATELGSTSMGFQTLASGETSTAMGRYSISSGYTSTTMGYFTEASERSATAMGEYSKANADYATAMGYRSNASGSASLAAGYESHATGDHSIAMGKSLWVPSENSTVFGQNINASSYNSFVVGRHAYNHEGWSKSEWVDSEPLFIIGNGHGDWDGDPTNAARNAITVLKNGKTAINHHDPEEMLDVNGNARFREIASEAYHGVVNRKIDGTLTTATSDERMKDNITTLDNILPSVMKMRGVRFTWKTEPEMGTRIGLLAQEVEPVFPELVFTNEYDGYKGINYAEFTAVLIEAIKEQQEQIRQLQESQQQAQGLESQQQQIQALQQENDLLREQIDQIIMMLSTARSE